GIVAVVTNVSVDHAEIIGPTLADIAIEKAGIVKPGATLVLGERSPELAPVFLDTPAGQVWARFDDFDLLDNRVAHGGRLLDLRTPAAAYHDMFLGLHGPYQGENAAVALAAAEAFFAQPLSEEVVAEAFAAVRSPGRMEVVGRKPLTIIDGAHNPAGAHALAAALDEEFGAVDGRVVLIGLLSGRDPDEMLEPLLEPGDTRLVVACAPPSPRAMAPLEIVGAATRLGVAAVAAREPAEALRLARQAVGEEELLLVTGSLYLVGALRSLVRG
ncbi:MAG TPA: cyanophycin synthetase, partial [Acidimicrobiales bacterium]